MVDGLEMRARVHAALGDPHRLAIVDAIAIGDLTPSELADRLDIAGNLVAHHLNVLDEAGLIERRVSEGDGRRRYVVLRRDRLASASPAPRPAGSHVLFVCTHNSARSQFAAALWRLHTGGPGESAGTSPADEVHPKAVSVAAGLGVDLTGAQTRGYGDVATEPDLVVSVCDRAAEEARPWDAPALHWSIPDPVVSGRLDAFRRAFAEISERVGTLARDDPR